MFPPFLRNQYWHTILCASIILGLSLAPQHRLPKPIFSYEDLVVHFLMYAGLSYCVSLSIYEIIRKKSSPLLHISIPIFLGLFGLGIEWLQKTLPINRYFSWEDALFNFFGASTFFFLALRIRSTKVLD